MKHFQKGIFFASLIFELPLFCQEVKVLNKEQQPLEMREFFVEGILKDMSRTCVAVTGIPYFIKSEQNPNLYLAWNDKKLSVSRNSSRSKNVIFFFKNSGDVHKPGHFSITSSKKNNEAIKVFDSTNWAILVHENDSQQRSLKILLDGKYVLLRNLDTDEITVKEPLTAQLLKDTMTDTWILEPAVNTRPATMEMDHERLMLKIPKKEEISQEPIAINELCCLLKLHGQEGFKHKTEDENFYYGATQETFYEKGVYISAVGEDTIVKISGVQGYNVGEGSSKEEAFEKKSPCRSQHIEIKSGKTLYIAPKNADAKMGKLVVHLGDHKAFNDHLSLNEIISSENRLRAEFIILVNDNKIEIVYGNRSSVLNPQSAAFVATNSAKVISQSVSHDLAVVVSNLSSSIESLGKSLEESSKTLGDALVRSANTASFAAIVSTQNLNTSIKYAADTFETSIKILSAAMNRSSADIGGSLKTVALSLQQASGILAESLDHASRTFGNDLKQSAVTLKESFSLLNQCIDNFGTLTVQSLQAASEKFIEGMAKVQNITVQHKVNLNPSFSIKN